MTKQDFWVSKYRYYFRFNNIIRITTNTTTR